MIELLKDPLFWLAIIQAMLKTGLIVIAIYIVYQVGYITGQSKMEKEFAKTPCGEFNKTTGKFEIIIKGIKNENCKNK